MAKPTARLAFTVIPRPCEESGAEGPSTLSKLKVRLWSIEGSSEEVGLKAPPKEAKSGGWPSHLPDCFPVILSPEPESILRSGAGFSGSIFTATQASLRVATTCADWIWSEQMVFTATGVVEKYLWYDELTCATETWLLGVL